MHSIMSSGVISADKNVRGIFQKRWFGGGVMPDSALVLFLAQCSGNHVVTGIKHGTPTCEACVLAFCASF